MPQEGVGMTARSASEQDERGAQLAALHAQLDVKRRRLEHRQLQAATYGLSVDPAILMEIEDLNNEIAALDRQIRDLERQQPTSVSPQSSTQQIFISYKRDAPLDEPLALRLH